MSDPLKRVVALCVVGAWMGLLTMPFAEALGRCQDTQECADQSIEQVLTIPAEHPGSLVSERSETLVVIDLFGIVPVKSTIGLSTVNSLAFFWLPSKSPPNQPSKLFQLFSVYRL